MLLEKINEDIKKAMLAKDTNKRDVLRSIKSRANLMAKERHSEINDDLIVKAIQKEHKELEQSIISLKGNTENKVYQDSKYRLELLEEYKPKLMSEDEVRTEVKRILSELGDVSFGEKMRAVMSELKGKADGKLLQSVVKEN